MTTLRVAVSVALLYGAVFNAPQTTTSYADVIDLYRRGDDEAALKKLALLTDSAITIGRDAILTAFTSPSFAEAYRAAAMMRAAAVLHTVRAFGARAHDDVSEFQ